MSPKNAKFEHVALEGDVDHRKKLNDKLGRKFGFPFNPGNFPLETMELPW